MAETANIPPTGGWQNWTDVELALPTPPEGTHELFVVFRGGAGGLMNLNFIDFIGKGAAISEAPEVTAAADPATGTAPLTVDFDGEATDFDGAPGDTLTYLWDFGVSGTTTDTSTELDPTFIYERPGTYTATLTVTDATGQKGRASVEVRVTSGEECPTGPVRSDEFDGDSLDTNRWTVIRSNDTFEVEDGQLRLPIDNGSIYEGGTTAQNIIVQDTPEGAWEVTAKVTAEELTENYHQAGLRVYSDDDNWASVHMISAGGQRDIEFIYEAGGAARNEAADKLGGIEPTDPTTYYVRIVSDGQQLTAFYSFDGDTFEPVGRPAPLSTFENPRIGPVALSDQAPSVPDAFFDWIRFDPDGTGGGGAGGRRRVRRQRAREPALGGRAPEPGPDGERRRAAHPGRARRHLRHRRHHQQRRQPGPSRRARGRLGGDNQGLLRGHGAVPPGRPARLRRRRQLHEVRPHRAHRGG